MHDLRAMRQEEARFREGLSRRGASVDLDGILALDRRRRGLQTEAESLKSERNRLSKAIGKRRQAGEDTAASQAEVRAMGERIAALDAEAREVAAALERRLLEVPNLPQPAAPDGADASGNVVVREVGARPEFPFEPKPHWQIGEELDLFDFDRATRMTGAGFPLLRGAGARLQRALVQFMLALHVREHGFTEVAPPCLCNAAAMTGTGQLPRMAEDMYRLAGDDLYLIPTAEVPLTNLYREEILAGPLPIRLTACTPCFRREAGAAGRETRGLNRVHQFEKVEMVCFTTPAESDAELGRLVANAEAVLGRLELPYRVVELCAGDLSFAAARCFDLELWAPGQQAWLEVSSCSNFEDFQARRAGIRYRDAEGKAAFLHTLNGSGVALPRLLVALIENGQQADGSVALPAALRPYMDGAERLGPPG